VSASLTVLSPTHTVQFYLHNHSITASSAWCTQGNVSPKV